MTKYIHQLNAWPKFHWNIDKIANSLAHVRHRQGKLIGRMHGLGFTFKAEANLQSLTEEVLKSNEIEGEQLNKDQVRSSIAKRLGIDIGGLVPSDRHVEGIVELMLDATQNYEKPLTRARLFNWQAALFPTGRSGLAPIITGGWRDDKKGPMQVISGPIRREHVHFQAPAAEMISNEITSFLKWFENDMSLDPVLKAGLAHLWFVTIHPFDDGNGRIARAITDMALARSENSAQRFYSMSTQIRQERKSYYDILEKTQKGSLEITLWLQWFLTCLDRTFDGAEDMLKSVLKKAHFWEKHINTPLNQRQRSVINKLLSEFEGKLTTSKWAKINACSQDTALRDIEDLIKHGILEKQTAGGRSTSYVLADINQADQSPRLKGGVFTP